MEKVKLISLAGLKTFLEKIQAWTQAKLDILDAKIDKKTWRGTKAELEVAIAEGKVDSSTIIIVTDDDDEEVVYTFCTLADIKALFPQYA